MAQQIPHNKRILLVEDDEDLCEATRIGLERQGYQVQGFLDPMAARTAFEAAPASWDLVITDQNMPSLSGMQLMKIVKTRRDDIPVIVWTGMGHLVAEETMRAQGASLYLSKPVDNAALVQAVKRIFSR